MRDFIEALASPYGKPAGLAAPQVGHSWQICFMQIPGEAKQLRDDVLDTLPLTVLINPSYKPIFADGKSKGWEGCFSVPDKMGEVYRYRSIHYQYYTESGELIKSQAQGLLARIIQHEVGHLNAELYTDLMTEDCRFGNQDDMLTIRQQELGQAQIK